jgi:hypothetical protein
MANLKFSDFTPYATTPVTATSGLVAYEGTTNIQFTPTQLAPFTGIYAANGIIGTARTALLTDILRFRDFTNTNDIFTLNSNGIFTLGLGAISTGGNTSTVIGRDANSAHQFTTNVGYGATTGGNYQVAIGSGSETSGSFAIAIGSNDTVTSGNKSITLNSTSGTGTTTNSSNETFAVYMTSKATPDFEVVGGGESTFNTSVKITGQAYTELHTGATPADPDWNNSNIQEMTLASLDQDFDPTNAKAGATYILKIKQPSSGAAGTINWNAASATVLWPAGTPPTLSTANNAVDIVTLICTDSASGGTYYANATLNFS